MPRQRGANGTDDFVFAERFRQARDSAPRDLHVVCVGGNEHDRNVPFHADELLLKLGPRHAGHRDVEDQASRIVGGVRFQEILGRREGPCMEPEGFQKVGQGFAYGFIIIYDPDYIIVFHNYSLAPLDSHTGR